MRTRTAGDFLGQCYIFLPAASFPVEVPVLVGVKVQVTYVS